MNNLIRMDFYRMRKNKTTWIILMFLILMMFASVYMSYSDIEYYKNNPSALENLRSSSEEVNWGIYIGSVSPKWCEDNEVPVDGLIKINIQSKIVLMFLVVFIVGFVSKENTSGFIKNIAGQVSNRGFILLSKMIIVGIYSLILLAVATVTIFLSSKILFGYVFVKNLGLLIKYILYQWILHVAYGSFMIFLITLLKNEIASLLIGILVSAGILQIVDAFIKSNKKSIMYFLNSGNIGRLSLGDCRPLLIAVVSMTIYMAISMYVINNRDIQ